VEAAVEADLVTGFVPLVAMSSMPEMQCAETAVRRSLQWEV